MESSKRELLLNACASGNVETIKELLREWPVDPKSIVDDEGGSLLHVASMEGHVGVVKFLVEELSFSCEERESSGSGDTAIHDAARGKSVPVLRYLIEDCRSDPACRSGDGRTPLHSACEVNEGNVDVVQYLIEKHRVSLSCADDEGNTPLHSAAHAGNLELVMYLCGFKGCPVDYRNREGDSPLDLAAAGDHLNVVKYFVGLHQYSPVLHKSECTPLHKACREGHLAVASYFIHDIGINPSDEDDEGQTALHYAALSGNVNLIKFLTDEKECNVYHQSHEGHTPLHAAAFGGNLEAVQYLISKKRCNPSLAGNDGFTPLHAACQNGHLNVAKYLVYEQQVDPLCRDKEGKTAVDFAAHSGNLDLVIFLLEDKLCCGRSQSNMPLLTAALSGHIEVVKYLIRKGYCDPHSKGTLGRTALHAACDGGNISIAQYLIDECNVSCACEDNNGDSPLHYAACHGNLNLAKLLLEQPSCNMYHRNTTGSTALHDTAYHGYLDIVTYLVSVKHCDPESKGGKGEWTPLHFASQEGHLDIVKYLVGEAGVNPICEDDDGITPVDAALAQGHQDIVQCLRKHLSRIQHVSSCKCHINCYLYSLPYMCAYLLLKHPFLSSAGELSQHEMKPLAKKRAHATGIVLGSGSFGTVIEVMVGHKLYAAKRYRTVTTDNFIRKISLEANILSNLQHPNIVQYYGLCCQSALDIPLLLMERLMTSLHSYLLQHAGTSIALPTKLAFLCDIASGLSYLHGLNPVIVHRDLTAKNVLLDTSLTAKIADFGNSRIIDMDAEMTPESMTAQPGTLDYMPPEAFGESANYTTSLDMFSFGHLALVVVAQKNIRLSVPKVRTANSQEIYSELERRTTYFDLLKNIISDLHSILPIIRHCLSDDPAQRPSAHEVESALLQVAGPHYYERKKAKKLGKCKCMSVHCCFSNCVPVSLYSQVIKLL